MGRRPIGRGAQARASSRAPRARTCSGSPAAVAKRKAWRASSHTMPTALLYASLTLPFVIASSPLPACDQTMRLGTWLRWLLGTADSVFHGKLSASFSIILIAVLEWKCIFRGVF